MIIRGKKLIVHKWLLLETYFELPIPDIPPVGTGTLVERTCVVVNSTAVVNTRVPEV